MIRMTRLRLINWHNFQDDTIDFKNITYLLGVNAVGKTTIMDAIRYCLTTNKDFNTAGNKKSGRTLLGSVHQKQRAENEFLRPGHTVSYIGIEFLDENINEKFVIIARIESNEPKNDLKGVYQDWYITINGYTLEDIPFITKVNNVSKPTSRDAFKLSNKKDMVRASNINDAKQKICRTLGIGDAESPNGKKFNEVFHMGTSLKDIKDIREFIYTYILPEPEVKIEFLKQDMDALEHLQEVLNEAKAKEELLEEINEKIKEANTYLSKIKINELLVTYSKYQGNIEEQKESIKKLDELKFKINELEISLFNIEKEEQESSRLYYEALNDVDNDKGNKEIQSLQSELRLKKDYYKQLENKASRIKEILGDLFLLKENLNKFGFSCNWEINIDDISVTPAEQIAEIEKISEILTNLNKPIRNRDTKIRVEINELNNQGNALKEKIKVLDSGEMWYPEDAITVKNSINDRLISLGKDAEAKLLCELLEMNDNSWQDAVESYLNTQRLNIIVSPENYLIAKEIFIALGDEVKRIGLVDTRKLEDIEYTYIGKEYLGDKIESSNVYARRYARYIMRDVICCDSPDELEQYKKSVTKKCHKFQHYCLQKMKKQDHYIGIDAIQKQLDKSKKDLSDIQKRQNKIMLEQDEFNAIIKQYNYFTLNNQLSYLETHINTNKEIKELKDKILKIEDQIEELKENPILCAMIDRIKECKTNLEAIKQKRTDIAAEKKNLEEQLNSTESYLIKLKESVDQLSDNYIQITEEYPEYRETVEQKYQEERKYKTSDAIISNFGKQVESDRTSLEKYSSNTLIPLQKKYSATYACDYLEGLDGAKQYQKEYQHLKRFELEHHKQELSDAQIRCKDRFRKDVLFRMKSDIEYAQLQFKKINRVMENLEYGEESYRFNIGKNKDKELGFFYDIIMDKNNLQIHQENETLSLFDEETRSEIFENQIEDFMSKIMMDVEEDVNENLNGNHKKTKNLNTYVDYRTYLDYDIIVTNAITGKEAPLSKVSGEGSGGENQAPFYVAICASLLQIYEQNQDGCMRLILLDEAFNNMTSDRIKPMMDMFSKLNFQLVLIATTEKATSIIPYCDITYSIVKSGNRNAIRKFEKIN